MKNGLVVSLQESLPFIQCFQLYLRDTMYLHTYSCFKRKSGYVGPFLMGTQEGEGRSGEGKRGRVREEGKRENCRCYYTGNSGVGNEARDSFCAESLSKQEYLL